MIDGKERWDKWSLAPSIFMQIPSKYGGHLYYAMQSGVPLVLCFENDSSHKYCDFDQPYEATVKTIPYYYWECELIEFMLGLKRINSDANNVPFYIYADGILHSSIVCNSRKQMRPPITRAEKLQFEISEKLNAPLTIMEFEQLVELRSKKWK